ncbi:MAG TPA: MFS transporter [Dehalococcoidia bacterium]|nr:MFS transporter [Dehalococcoidia bacterium]
MARRLPFFYGWVIVAICFLTVFLTGTTSYWGLTVFVGPMHDDTGWSNTGILGALAARSLVAATVGLFTGRLADRLHGPRVLLLAGILIDGSSLALLRFVESPLQFVVLYGVVGGIGSTGTRMLMGTLIPKWFVAGRGPAIGLAAVGGSISALVMIPAVALMIEGLGWRDSWTLLAALQMALLLPCVVLTVRAPEDMGLLPDNGLEPAAGTTRISASAERSYTLGEAVHTWRLWLLLLAMFVGTYSLSAHTLVMVPYFKEVGFSAAIAASAMSSYGVFSIVSRFLWGHVSQRYSTRHAIVVQSLFTALGAVLLLQIAGRTSLYIVAGFQGLVLSGFPILQSLVWPEFFGRRHIGSIVGTMQFFLAFATAGAQVSAGLLYDHSGTYETTIFLMIGTWIACSALMLGLRPASVREAVALPAT